MAYKVVPLGFGNSIEFIEGDPRIEDEDGKALAYAIDEESAEGIVKALNEHAALREIAQALVDFDNKGDGMDDNQRDLYEVCFLPLVEKARAVLADDDEPVS